MEWLGARGEADLGVCTVVADRRGESGIAAALAAGIAVAGVVLVIVAAIVCYRRRRRRLAAEVAGGHAADHAERLEDPKDGHLRHGHAAGASEGHFHDDTDDGVLPDTAHALASTTQLGRNLAQRSGVDGGGGEGVSTMPTTSSADIELMRAVAGREALADHRPVVG